MTSTVIPNLDPTTERGFTLDTGELVAVKIVRPQLMSQASVVAVTISARMVDAQGKTLVVGGVPVVMPGHTISFMSESLGDGSTILLPAVAAAMQQEASKCRGFMSALSALSSFSQAD